MSMATKDTHPAVMADSGSPSGPALAPVSSLTCQPACHFPGCGPAGGHDRAQPCWICPLWRALNGLDRAAATPAETGAARPADLEDAPDRRVGADTMVLSQEVRLAQIVQFGGASERPSLAGPAS